jgi:putative restriction endonuclease
MLLAMLDLANAGALETNRIYFSPALLERYLSYFLSTKSKKDKPNPQYPFIYLSGKLNNGELSFWHLKKIDENIQMKSGGEYQYIKENIEFAYLNDDLFQLIQKSENIKALENVLSTFWFDRTKEDFKSIVEKNSQISEYEKKIRQGACSKSKSNPSEFIRNPAFRKVIIEVYDYRCAATGSRIILPSGEALVEAAHIHPFSVTGDDDPRNGLALTPNMHWAMDKNIISPGPDKKWHVSKSIDRRISDLQIFTSLEGLPLILPKESTYEPKIESLEWRLSKLR